MAHVVGSDVNSLHTLTGQVLGTVVYMSPEQARGGRATARSDQFSLGVILYELLCGHLPFETRDQLVHDALSSLADGVWVPPSVYEPSLRGNLETVLAKALDSNPTRRYASVADFAADLEAWLGGRPIAARPPSRLYQLGMLIKRNRAMSVSLVAIVLALLVGTGVAVYGITRAWSEARMAALFTQREQLDALVAEADDLWPADSTQAAAMGRAFLAKLEAEPLPVLTQGDHDGSWLTNEARRLARGSTAAWGRRSRCSPKAARFPGEEPQEASRSVMIPGGSVLIGAQRTDPTAPRFDPFAFPPPGDNGNEGPP